ncbi:hypothetical protein CIPAW_07G168300 [Carya illinoinensis]|uniref:Uncharacterized protein n=1 Tax=Carya illinoinensis TaxID=32201 RepID=A0A8T1Q041_CARIL|nr:hypothetical protein CIPAW_07G168300 [Carya illinoinensis]
MATSTICSTPVASTVTKNNLVRNQTACRVWDLVRCSHLGLVEEKEKRFIISLLVMTLFT